MHANHFIDKCTGKSIYFFSSEVSIQVYTFIFKGGSILDMCTFQKTQVLVFFLPDYFDPSSSKYLYDFNVYLPQWQLHSRFELLVGLKKSL